jgi:hypothetical protein
MVYSSEPTIVYQFLSKLLHANRSLSHANRVSDHGSLARRETVFGGQRQQAPNRLQAVFVPYRDRERANAPAQNRGYSAKDRKSQVAHRTSPVQYDLTLRYAIAPRCFYA